ncbi:hypothetical protein CDAR_542021 [Caerostris darwini]|uniref:Uncharacterized protein n=1 Tax=Caerostris darwini TaxID=1538125 RepID=A0AAV4UUD4_9ARAC|nr:hypothetical protein CDAR_542021 [Caerostris darwini]
MSITYLPIFSNVRQEILKFIGKITTVEATDINPVHTVAPGKKEKKNRLHEKEAYAAKVLVPLDISEGSFTYLLSIFLPSLKLTAVSISSELARVSGEDMGPVKKKSDWWQGCGDNDLGKWEDFAIPLLDSFVRQ